MKFHDPISTEAGKQLIQLTAAGVFYTYALENRKKIEEHSKTLLETKVSVAYRIKQKSMNWKQECFSSPRTSSN